MKKDSPVQYVSHGVDVLCPICRNDTFVAGRAQLNTMFLTFLNLDWANREVQILTCAKCRHILWFDDTDDNP